MEARTRAEPKHKRLAADERRQDLIDATLDCLSTLGPHGTGVREICKQAGVSPGLLRHYFEGKNDLIIEAYRALTREYHSRFHDALQEPEAPADHRLRAFFDAYFSNRATDRDRVGTYIAYWTLGRTDPTIQRIQRSAYRKLKKLLALVLVDLAEDRGAKIDAEQLASSLIALLDGFWLDMCIDPKRFSRAVTSAIYWEWLETYLRGSRTS
jgi:TetR/AcrR family transcriptional repressor of bet genes